MPTERRFFSPRQMERGRHEAFSQPIEGEYGFRMLLAGGLARYNAVTGEIQKVIGECVGRRRLRARGSLWSLSRVAVTDGALMDTKNLRIGFRIPASAVASSYHGDRTNLLFVESGTSISKLNQALFAEGLSMPTSGSNNGQTVAGALSTGTHGAAFNFGAIPDFVVGLHVVNGKSSSVYLQRQSRKVVKKGFATKLGAELIEDDDVFNAALVSFGSFGVIHGVMVEARPSFLLHAVRFRHKFNRKLKRAMETLDLSPLTLPAEASGVPRGKPHHFEVVFNPNEGTPPDEAVVLVMYEGAMPSSYEPPEWEVEEFGPGADGLSMIGTITDMLPSPLNQVLVGLLNDQVRDRLHPYYKKGAIKDLFRGEAVVGKTLASAMAMDRADALAALDIVMQTYDGFDEVLPALIDMRFVKGGSALLGFTKFRETAVIEFDSVNSVKSRQFLKEVWKAMDAAGIPFTLHWGKFNSHLTGPRLRQKYSDDVVDRWIAARERVLATPALREVFTNPFMERVGLAT